MVWAHRYKGSREIFDNDKFEIKTEGEKHILVVKDVYGEDADEYSARASNKGGSRVSRCQLEIRCEYSEACCNTGQLTQLNKLLHDGVTLIYGQLTQLNKLLHAGVTLIYGQLTQLNKLLHASVTLIYGQLTQLNKLLHAGVILIYGQLTQLNKLLHAGVTLIYGELTQLNKLLHAGVTLIYGQLTQVNKLLHAGITLIYGQLTQLNKLLHDGVTVIYCFELLGIVRTKFYSERTYNSACRLQPTVTLGGLACYLRRPRGTLS